MVEIINKFNFKGIYPISALENQNVEHVLEDIKEILPEGPQYYPSDMITDHPERFLIAEIIREKVLQNTEEEVPHSVAVVIDILKKNEVLKGLQFDHVVTNPPYGERLLTVEEAESLYRAMGEAFARLEKWQIYVITQSEIFPKLYGRRADKIRKLYNGMIPCYYYQFFKNGDKK